MKKYFTTTLFLLVGLIGFSQTGSVGVGTNVPLTKLDINGDLALREGTAISVTGLNATLVVTLSASDVENSFYRITDGSPVPTGILALNSIANGADGQIITLVNATTIKLKITNTNFPDGILTPGAQTQVIFPNGSVTLQYSATAFRWFITNSSGSILVDWLIATTPDEPAISTDNQYVTGNVGVGDFSGATSTPAERLEVLDGNAQITSIANGDIPSLNFYSGSNVTLNTNQKSRINFWEPAGKGSWGTYIEHLDDDGIFCPSRGAGALLNHLVLGSVKAGIYNPIISMNDGNTYTGRVGIRTTDPSATLHVVAPAATTSFAARFTQTNTTNGRNMFIGLGTENAIWSKAAIGYQRTGSYDVGDITFNLNNDAASNAEVSVTDEKVRIKNNGDIKMTGSQGKLWLETNGWSDPGTTGAGIAVDNNSYKTMMIVGNNVTGNKGQKREIQMWDYVKINGYLTVGDQTKATATNPPSGTMRYNTTRNCMEYWDGTYWICMGPPTVQKVTVRDQTDANYRGTGCNACSGWESGGYGPIYTFTINNLYAGQKIMFYVEIFLDNNTKLNNAYANAMKIYGNGYFAEDEVMSPSWEQGYTKVFPAQTITSGTGSNLNFYFECNQGYTDVRITAVAY